MAVMKGFEPSVSAVTEQRIRPLCYITIYCCGIPAGSLCASRMYTGYDMGITCFCLGTGTGDRTPIQRLKVFCTRHYTIPA
jgi:hypothetical protein